MITICKFFYSQNSNQLITATFGKVGIIPHNWLKDHPDIAVKEKDFWKVDVFREIHPSQNKGVFYVEPLEQVLPDDINRLYPGSWSQNISGNVLIINPITKGYNWIMPLKFKRSILETYKDVCAIIVNLGGETWKLGDIDTI